MKLKVTHEEGNFFKKADIGENFVTTNVFGGGSRTQPRPACHSIKYAMGAR